MAEHDNQISKDTGSREDTKTATESEIEADAVIAYWKTKVARLEKNASFTTAQHKKGLSDLENKFMDSQNKLLEEHKKVLQSKEAELVQAHRKTLQNRQEIMQQCRATVDKEKVSEIEELRDTNATLVEGVKRLKSQVEDAKAETERTSKTMTDFARQKGRRIADLQRQLTAHPNSWIQVHFHCRSRKRKTSWHKYNAKFKEAVAELSRKVSAVGYAGMRFEYDGKTVDGNKTLEELGIGEGAVVTYTKL